MLNADMISQLAALADTHDRAGAWPAESMKLLDSAGVWGWVIPRAHGGTPLDGVDRLRGYEDLAAGCLASALIVTQQHGACELIAEGDNGPLRERVLPAYARGARRCTLGISQLTTSTSGGTRQMRVARRGADFVFDGRMPWSTAPGRCDDVVTGGLFDNDEQLLVCMALATPGVEVGEPMSLMALDRSWTTIIDCHDVVVERGAVVRGPAPRVLDRRSTVKPLTVSAVGVGMARAIIAHSRGLLDRYEPEFAGIIDRVERRYDDVRAALHEGARRLETRPQGYNAAPVRVQVNDLVVRAALVNQLLAKGSGYARDHRAARLSREALFFLVWSAPTAVQLDSLKLMLDAWE